MAKIYIGKNNSATEVKKIYCSVNNVTKHPTKVYIGKDGKAVQIYPNGSPVASGTYTVRIDLSNSDPETWGTYMDDAEGMTAGDDAFDDFFGHYPCVLNNGVELGKLKRDDFTKYENGADAPISTVGNDAMTYYPRRGLKIWMDGSYLYVSITTDETLSDYGYDAFTYKGQACDGFYRGCFKGYMENNILYSVLGKTPTTNVTIGNFRTYARNHGTNYEQSAYYQLTYLQAMYLIKYRGRNAQIAVGRGFTDSGNSAIYGVTGYTVDKGMDWGETTGKFPMKLFGQEDFFGNIWEFIDGIWSNASRQLSASDGDYNDTGSGYTVITTKTNSSNYSGYMRYPIGTTQGGFAPDVSTRGTYGSETTYFCDYASVYASRMADFGGRWANAGYAGVFRLDVNLSASDASANIGARLMFFKVRS